MNLSPAPAAYDQRDEASQRDELRKTDAKNVKVGRDIEMGSARLIFTASDGSRWAKTVNTSGAWVTTGPL